jgi:hypothetical protein
MKLKMLTHAAYLTPLDNHKILGFSSDYNSVQWGNGVERKMWRHWHL